MYKRGIILLSSILLLTACGEDTTDTEVDDPVDGVEDVESEGTEEDVQEDVDNDTNEDDVEEDTNESATHLFDELINETTFSEDTDDKEVLKSYIYDFSLEIEDSLVKNHIQGKTVILKVKYEYFKVITRSKTLDNYLNTSKDIYQVASSLLDEIDLAKKVRLIGVTLSNLSFEDIEQLSFFD